MKNTTKLITKSVILGMLLSGSIAVAASGTDETFANVTLEKRLYQYDGFGAQWALDTGSDGLWLVPKDDVGGVYSAPFKLRNAAAADTLVIGGNDEGTEGYVGIGTDTPKAQLNVERSGSNTAGDGLTTLTLLEATNTVTTKSSDAAFALKNGRTGKQWNFRTTGGGNGFSATIDGTGGPEFKITNTTGAFADAKMVVGGITVFENGHVVTASSRTLKTDIKPLDTQAALDAFHKLQPVSFAYKAHQGEPVVGFIAEDVPELVAMPSRKTFDSTEVVAVLTSVLAETRAEMEEMRAEIAELKAMRER